METVPRFTLPDDDKKVRTARRQIIARFARDLARWLVRLAGPGGLVVRRHSNGEFTLEVELPMRPGFGRMGPAKVRVIVTDYAAD
jgi:hypothetical protein